MRKILYGFGGAAAAAADPIGDIEALLPAGSYFWLADDAVPTSGSGTITAWVDRLQSLDAGENVNSTPTAQDDGTLGKRVVAFDGTDDHLFTTTTITLAQPFSVFVVAKASASTDGVLSVGGESTSYFSTDGGLWTGRWALSVQGTTTITDSVWRSGAHLANGASSETWTDGSSEGTGNAGASGWSTDVVYIAARGVGDRTFAGSIAAVVLAAGDISSDIATIHTHFDTYYGGALP